MPFSGTLTLLKTTCEEPCNGGGTGGGGGTNYQPQIDKINEHLTQNDQKLTNLDVETANIKNDLKQNYATKTYVDNAKDAVENQIDTLANNVASENQKLEQSIRNINNDLNNNYVTKLEQADEVDKLNKRIDGISGGGSGIDYQPQIDELKNKNNQLDQRIVDNAGKIQANENEINNIKTNYASKLDLAQNAATIMSDCNDYTDEKIKELKVSVDGNNALITNVEGRVQVLEQNQGTGGGGGSTNLDSFIIISVSIQDGNVNCLAYNPNTAQQYINVDWGIVYKYSFFDGRSFTGVVSKTISDRSFSYDNFTDKVLFINARISATINGVQYITGLKQTMFNNGDVDYVAGANLRLIAIRS